MAFRARPDRLESPEVVEERQAAAAEARVEAFARAAQSLERASRPSPRPDPGKVDWSHFDGRTHDLR